ncbi:MAG: N-acetylmuramoyl-L-alanine amidase [Nitrospirae bacterium]|nr:N-acetylmuramoyl-L-alanine amidase [Nitrospirota bacterium]
MDQQKRILLAVVVLGLLWPGSVQEALAKSPSASLLFQQAEAKCRNLGLHGPKTDSRLWEHCLERYEAVAEKADDPSLISRALFRRAELFWKRYQQDKHSEDLDRTVEACQRLLDRHPSHPEAEAALFLLAEAYERKEDPEQALAAYRRYLEAYPKGKQVHAARLRVSQLDEPSAALKQVGEIRHSSTPGARRVVVDLDGAVRFEQRRLSHPDRLYLDLHGAVIDRREPIAIDDGIVKRIRASQFAPHIARIVLDLEAVERYEVSTLDSPQAGPFRIVIDLRGTPSGTGSPPSLEATKAPAKRGDRRAAPTDVGRDQAQTVAYAPQKRAPLSDPPPVRRIVIDPGHGGKDTGAKGPNGLLEKEVALDIAKRLAKILRERMDVEAILTRDEDVFLELPERTAIANARKADLFISIHLNASPQPAARGVETYVLNLTNSHDQKALAIAARENGVSLKRLNDWELILQDKQIDAKKEESLSLAKSVQKAMVEQLGRRYQVAHHAEGVRQGPFWVLYGAQMPSILAEVSFVSNPAEAKRLKGEKYRQEVAEALFRGIQAYAASGKTAAVER